LSVDDPWGNGSARQELAPLWLSRLGAPASHLPLHRACRCIAHITQDSRHQPVSSFASLTPSHILPLSFLDTLDKIGTHGARRRWRIVPCEVPRGERTPREDIESSRPSYFEPIAHFTAFSRLWKHTGYRICADGGANRLYDMLKDDLIAQREQYVSK
jgi:hypothetical protein